MAKKRLGVLTGGGDVPGLNPAIKAVVLNALDAGYEIIGIRRGWGGLLRYDINNSETHNQYIRCLDRQSVRRVDRQGGTFLHTSRTNPSKVRQNDIPEFLKGSEYGKKVSEDGVMDYTDYCLKGSPPTSRRQSSCPGSGTWRGRQSPALSSW